MASNYTTNYQLNQWAKSDRLMMDDFNSDNQKIDAALKAVADGGTKIVTGTYTGTGEYGAAHPNTLTFDFVPKILWITAQNQGATAHRAVLLHGCTAASSSDYFSYGISSVTWNDAARSVTWYADYQGGTGSTKPEISAQMNSKDTIYLYVAIG